MGPDGAGLSCPGSSVVAESTDSDCPSSSQSQSRTEESETEWGTRLPKKQTRSSLQWTSPREYSLLRWMEGGLPDLHPCLTPLSPLIAQQSQ